MFNHFRFLYFFIGLGIGLFAAYFYKPEKQIIKQYPHPSEAHEKVFKDPNGTCYKYTSHEVNCDANEGTLQDYPVQG